MNRKLLVCMFAPAFALGLAACDTEEAGQAQAPIVEEEDTALGTPEGGVMEEDTAIIEEEETTLGAGQQDTMGQQDMGQQQEQEPTAVAPESLQQQETQTGQAGQGGGTQPGG